MSLICMICCVSVLASITKLSHVACALSVHLICAWRKWGTKVQRQAGDELSASNLQQRLMNALLRQQGGKAAGSTLQRWQRSVVR